MALLLPDYAGSWGTTDGVLGSVTVTRAIGGDSPGDDAALSYFFMVKPIETQCDS